jgi:hypothetical protein
MAAAGGGERRVSSAARWLSAGVLGGLVVIGGSILLQFLNYATW